MFGRLIAPAAPAGGRLHFRPDNQRQISLDSDHTCSYRTHLISLLILWNFFAAVQQAYCEYSGYVREQKIFLIWLLSVNVSGEWCQGGPEVVSTYPGVVSEYHHPIYISLRNLKCVSSTSVLGIETNTRERESRGCFTFYLVWLCTRVNGQKRVKKSVKGYIEGGSEHKKESILL